MPIFETCSDSKVFVTGSNLLGIAQTPLGVFLNHSCHKNVEKFALQGPRFVFYAERSIKKDEEVSISLSFIK